MTKNGKYLETVTFCHSLVLSSNEERVNGGFTWRVNGRLQIFTAKFKLVFMSPSVV